MTFFPACGICTEVSASAIPMLGMVGVAVSYIVSLFRRRRG